MADRDGEFVCESCRAKLNSEDRSCWRCGSRNLKDMRPSSIGAGPFNVPIRALGEPLLVPQDPDKPTALCSHDWQPNRSGLGFIYGRYCDLCGTAENFTLLSCGCHLDGGPVCAQHVSAYEKDPWGTVRELMKANAKYDWRAELAQLVAEDNRARELDPDKPMELSSAGVYGVSPLADPAVIEERLAKNDRISRELERHTKEALDYWERYVLPRPAAEERVSEERCSSCEAHLTP